MDKQFYRFRSDDKRSVIKLHTDTKYTSLDIEKGHEQLSNVNDFFIYKGSKEYDVIQFSHSGYFAISEKFKCILIDNKVNGINLRKININGINNNYYFFENIGKAGSMTNKERRMERLDKFVEFDINTWDGSDIFNLEGTLINACTERVKDILEAAKLTNLEIKPL